MLLQHLYKLLDDPRRRSVIIITLLISLTMFLVGGIRLFRQVRHQRFPSVAKIESMRDINSVPGGMAKHPTRTYAELQIKENQRIAEQAKQTGRSAIATIVDGFHLTDHQTHAFKESKSSEGLSEADRIMLNHQHFVSEQQMEVNKQQIQGAMHQQIQQLFEGWSRSPVQEQNSCIEENVTTGLSASHQTTESVVIKAGTILQAVLLTEINSDEQSPVLAKITTGEFKDARLVGTLSLVGERLLVQFHTLSPAESKHTLSINALAIDEASAKTSLATQVDRHTLLRYGSLFAAAFLEETSAFLQGYGMRVGGEQKSENVLNATKSILYATGNIGSHASGELAQHIHRPPTVYVHAGKSIGILFSNDVHSPSSL